MITRLSTLALGASLLSSPLIHCISPSEIPSDTPIASLVSSAKSHLAQGNPNDALTYFDVAVSRDPRNYLTIFQRGATYLSLGKNDKASQDFDKVLTIRPDFEGALLQRAKIKSRNADWVAAKEDYVRAKKTESADFIQLEEAWGAASLASDAEKAGDWEGCVGHAGTAIMVASTALNLRQLRARCRFERGEVLEGVSDLAHALQISPSAIEPHMQISTMMFFSMADKDKGIEQMRKCLRSDPDSKTCSKLFRREKQLDKVLKQASALKDKRQFNSAVKLLVGTAEDPGLMQDVKEDVKEFKEAGYIHKNSPDELYSSLVEMACECYTEVRILVCRDCPTFALTRVPDQQEESGPLLYRGSHAERPLAPRSHRSSAKPTRCRRLRSRHRHPEPRKRTPSCCPEYTVSPPKGPHPAQAQQNKGLLQSIRRPYRR